MGASCSPSPIGVRRGGGARASCAGRAGWWSLAGRGGRGGLRGGGGGGPARPALLAAAMSRSASRCDTRHCPEENNIISLLYAIHLITHTINHPQTHAPQNNTGYFSSVGSTGSYK